MLIFVNEINKKKQNMKSIVNVKNETSLVYQSEFNTLSAAVEYAKLSIKEGFNTPIFMDAKRKEVFVNVKKSGANKFFKCIVKN